MLENNLQTITKNEICKRQFLQITQKEGNA